MYINISKHLRCVALKFIFCLINQFNNNYSAHVLQKKNIFQHCFVIGRTKASIKLFKTKDSSLE